MTDSVNITSPVNSWGSSNALDVSGGSDSSNQISLTDLIQQKYPGSDVTESLSPRGEALTSFFGKLQQDSQTPGMSKLISYVKELSGDETSDNYPVDLLENLYELTKEGYSQTEIASLFSEVAVMEGDNTFKNVVDALFIKDDSGNNILQKDQANIAFHREPSGLPENMSDINLVVSSKEISIAVIENVNGESVTYDTRVQLYQTAANSYVDSAQHMVESGEQPTKQAVEIKTFTITQMSYDKSKGIDITTSDYKKDLYEKTNEFARENGYEPITDSDFDAVFTAATAYVEANPTGAGRLSSTEEAIFDTVVNINKLAEPSSGSSVIANNAKDAIKEELERYDQIEALIAERKSEDRDIENRKDNNLEFLAELEKYVSKAKEELQLIAKVMESGRDEDDSMLKRYFKTANEIGSNIIFSNGIDSLEDLKQFLQDMDGVMKDRDAIKIAAELGLLMEVETGISEVDELLDATNLDEFAKYITTGSFLKPEPVK